MDPYENLANAVTLFIRVETNTMDSRSCLEYQPLKRFHAVDSLKECRMAPPEIAIASVSK
jgi:hypothetical protein